MDQQYPCKCIGFGRICGGCAASLDMQTQERAREAFDVCAPTMRSAELTGVQPISRDELAGFDGVA